MLFFCLQLVSTVFWFLLNNETQTYPRTKPRLGCSLQRVLLINEFKILAKTTSQSGLRETIWPSRWGARQHNLHPGIPVFYLFHQRSGYSRISSAVPAWCRSSHHRRALLPSLEQTINCVFWTANLLPWARRSVTHTIIMSARLEAFSRN